jgi:transcriptional regulator with XRE-family HTH domain
MTGLIRIPVGTALSAVINDMLELTGTRPAELARLTGFAEGQISKWRRGVVVPSAPVLLALFGALDFDLAAVPRIKDGPTTGPASTVSDQGAEMHTRLGVDHSNGATGLSGWPLDDSCTCPGTAVSTNQPDPDCPVHHGRRARGPKPPPVGPGCICDGSERTCPRHGAVI